MSNWYRISLVCGLVPICIGTLIFICWWFVRTSWLEVAGGVTLYIGLAVFFIGLISIAVYFFQARKNAITGYKKKSIVVLVILLANFPVAAAIISTVIYVVAVSTIQIENQSTTKVENMLLSERGHIYKIGSVLPSEKIEKKIHFQSEGSVYYSFIKGETKYEGNLFGYVTGGVGYSAVIVVAEAGVRIDRK